MEGEPTLSAEDRFAIQQLLFHFMRSFDEKDWGEMRSCLGDSVDCDYSRFRGTPRSTIKRDKYIDQRKTALESLRTQHNLSNISIIPLGTHAEVKCNYAILRFHPEFDGSQNGYFHSYGQYWFAVVSIGKEWSISAIKQTPLMSEGNPDLHGALQKKVPAN